MAFVGVRPAVPPPLLTAARGREPGRPAEAIPGAAERPVRGGAAPTAGAHTTHTTHYTHHTPHTTQAIAEELHCVDGENADLTFDPKVCMVACLTCDSMQPKAHM